MRLKFTFRALILGILLACLSFSSLYAQSENAILWITSNVNGAQVLVDNQRIGNTTNGEFYSENISAGQHAIELRRNGYVSARAVIQFTAGLSEQLTLNLTLIPQPEVADQPEETVEPIITTPDTVSVLVNTNQTNVGVYLAGSLQGYTDQNGQYTIQTTAGEYQLELVKEGFSSAEELITVTDSIAMTPVIIGLTALETEAETSSAAVTWLSENKALVGGGIGLLVLVVIIFIVVGRKKSTEAEFDPALAEDRRGMSVDDIVEVPTDDQLISRKMKPLAKSALEDASTDVTSTASPNVFDASPSFTSKFKPLRKSAPAEANLEIDQPELSDVTAYVPPVTLTPEPIKAPAPEVTAYVSPVIPPAIPTPEPVKAPAPEVTAYVSPVIPPAIPTPEPVKAPAPEVTAYVPPVIPPAIPTPEPLKAPAPEVAAYVPPVIPPAIPTPEPVKAPAPEVTAYVPPVIPLAIPTPEPVKAPEPATPEFVLPTGHTGYIQFDEFSLMRPLGRGEFSSVYLAKSRTNNQRFALKVLDAILMDDPSQIQYFFNEANTLKRILEVDPQAPVPRVYNQGYEDNDRSRSPFIVLEFIEGISLSNYLRMAPSPAPYVVLEVIRQIGQALLAAHQVGAVHKRISPEKIIVERKGAGLTVRLLDFGMVKALTQDEIKRVSVTQLAYWAPEQCRGEQPTDKSDVYALGVLLYHLLTGQTPFMALEAAQLISLHETAIPPTLPTSIPAPLRQLVRFMLTKRPQDRPSMSRLLDDMDMIKNMVAQHVTT